MKTLSRFFALLSHNEKRNFMLLCGFMVINALVQVFGIASIAPLMAAIMEPDSITKIPYLSQVYNIFEFENHQQASVFLGFLILLIMVLGNLFILLTTYLSLRYTNNREKSIGTALLQAYIGQPYVFFLNRHSSELLRNVYNEVSFIASNIISRLLNLITCSISALGIVIFIFIVNPYVTIILTAVLGGAYLLVYLGIKRSLYFLGKKSVALTEVKLKTISDSVHLIKDIKMNALEGMFIHDFKTAASEYARIRTLSDISGIAPKYIIEIFAVGALVLAIIYLTSTESNMSTLLPTLGIYAFAGFRLMPALQQIFLALSKIQFSTHSLNLIASEMDAYQKTAMESLYSSPEPIKFKAAFGLRNASFSYAEEQFAVRNLTMLIKRGEKIGIVGKSGEGKSTIIDLLVGLASPNEGELTIDGRPLTESAMPAWRANIAYISQIVYLLDDTIDMNITLEINPANRDASKLAAAKKHALIDFDKDSQSRTIGENGQRLSGGQKQRIGIARALYQNKPILILDESTSAMDQETEKEMLNRLKNLDKTLILVTHKVDTMDFCDKIYLIKAGKIEATGSFKSLKKTNALFKTLLKNG